MTYNLRDIIYNSLRDTSFTSFIFFGYIMRWAFTQNLITSRGCSMTLIGESTSSIGTRWSLLSITKTNSSSFKGLTTMDTTSCLESTSFLLEVYIPSHENESSRPHMDLFGIMLLVSIRNILTRSSTLMLLNSIIEDYTRCLDWKYNWNSCRKKSWARFLSFERSNFVFKILMSTHL